MAFTEGPAARNFFQVQGIIQGKKMLYFICLQRPSLSWQLRLTNFLVFQKLLHFRIFD